MANLNKVLLIGRLTRDPESRSTPSGASVTSFGLAVNRVYIRKDSGEKVEETCFVDIEAWGRTGENIQRYMSKGRQLFVEGRLKFDSWEKDGQRRSKLSVVAEVVQFLDGGGDRGGEGGRGQQQQGGRQEGGARRNTAPVGAKTPQDDYGEADDIPF